MVGEKIKQYRIKKGLSINQLAIDTNISKSYLSHIERGIQKNPSINVLSAIAKRLDTTVEHLMEETSQRRIDEEWIDLFDEITYDGVSKEEFKILLEFMKFKKRLSDE